MDPLTPSKIQRLLNLAEGSTYSMPGKRLLLSDADCRRLGAPTGSNMKSKDEGTGETSSGLLDLDQLQGFGEADMGSMSKSTSFHPGEITGRSTGADDIPKTRHSCFNMESLTNELNKQTFEVEDIMRHSIASNYSFHSKCLTADEASLVARNAPLPTQPTYTNFQESSVMNTSEASVGAYFRTRCPEFDKVLTQTDSPDRSSMRPSLTEVSYNTEGEKHCYKLDPSLDSIPVRQPRNPPSDQVLVPQSAEKARLDNTNKLPVTKKENLKPFKVPTSAIFDHQLKTSALPERKMAPAKGTDLFVKAVTHSSSMMKAGNDESSIAENSLTISKIAEILGNQSTNQSVNISDIMNQYSKNPSKRLPESKKKPELPVTYLKDVRNVESGSSSGSVQTVLSASKPSVYSNNSTIPEVVITRHSLSKTDESAAPEVKGEYTGRKSLSTNSRSTLSTVHENTPGSPLQSSKGEVNTSQIPSPNVEYKELDKSVDWHEVMQQTHRRRQGLAKVSEAWAEITATPVSGFVGVTCAASVSIMTLTDSWLTATFNFDAVPNLPMDLRIDLPRQPLLLSPGKTELLQIHITPNAEMNTVLPFTISLKDSSTDTEIEHNGSLAVDFKMPVVQAMSLDGINKVSFPPIPEKTFLTRNFVLISDSPVDLQLSLSVVGGNMFAIKNVQEIKTSEVNRVLKEQCQPERVTSTKLKHKAPSKQLCRVTRGHAIRATVTFEAPSLSDNNATKPETFTGAICVNLIGVESTIKRVELAAAVGAAALAFSVPDNKLLVTKGKPETFTGAICVNLIGVESTIKRVELAAAVGAAALAFSVPDNKLLVTKGKPETFTGAICVNLIGVESTIKRVELAAAVGAAALAFSVPDNKLLVTKGKPETFTGAICVNLIGVESTIKRVELAAAVGAAALAFSVPDNKLLVTKGKPETFTGAICVNLIGVESTIKRVELAAAVGAAALAFSVPDNKLLVTKGKPETFTGAICVNLIGVESTIKRVELAAAVGAAALAFSAPDNKLLVTKELTTLTVHNSGSIPGEWVVNKQIDERNYFDVSDTRLELAPGEAKPLVLSYGGPDNCINISPLIFEETTTGCKTTIELSGGAERPKQFPIKTNCQSLSWIRSGRKELSLKNTSDRKVTIRCQILGEPFSIDMPGVDARGTCCIIHFAPNECRPLPIVYSPNNFMPNAASLHLIFDKNSEYTRKVGLYGCPGCDALRWSGLATYGETALVRAVPRCHVDLRLTNRAPMPAFVAARVYFNLQYMSVAASCRLEGAQRVVGARGAHGVSLRVDWARVERRALDSRAPTLATLTALTGPELTRRRILRILRSEGNGQMDTSLLPENLRILADAFEGEDENMDILLADFNETKASLVELIGGLQELKAQIDLPQDIAEETVIYLDDTVAEHHTLYEQ